MKGVVKIKNMRVYAFHGCLKEESKIGGDYLVNLRAYCNLVGAAESDSLEETANYTQLAKIITKEIVKLWAFCFYEILYKEIVTRVSFTIIFKNLQS